jgi:stage II sporulation protein P
MKMRIVPSRRQKSLIALLYLVGFVFVATNLDMVIGFNLAEPETILQNQIVAMAVNIEREAVAVMQDVEMPDDEQLEPPEGMLPILALDMHVDNPWGVLQASENIFVRNSTNLTPDVNEIFNTPLRIKLDNNGPQVLIIHTHATEAFLPTGGHYYDPSAPMRTQDMEHTVMRVGAEMMAVLNDMGVQTVQCRGVHDTPTFNGSYRRALESIEKYLRQYPSIKVVIDVHRDSMQRADGTRLKNVTDINGEQVAQVMILSGTDASGLSHPSWRDNLNLAMHWQEQMNSDFPRLTRAIELREERFNMHATLGSLLIEVGSTGHTLEEAIRGGKMAAESLGRVLLNLR